MTILRIQSQHGLQQDCHNGVTLICVGSDIPLDPLCHAQYPLSMTSRSDKMILGNLCLCGWGILFTPVQIRGFIDRVRLEKPHLKNFKQITFITLTSVNALTSYYLGIIKSRQKNRLCILIWLYLKTSAMASILWCEVILPWNEIKDEITGRCFYQTLKLHKFERLVFV